jgi:drug/metabolite transporter (DMT)-like permease
VSIDSAVATILNSTVPLFTMLIAHLYHSDDRITPGRFFALLTGFVRVIILVSRDLNAALQSSLLGQLAVLLVALHWSIVVPDAAMVESAVLWVCQS